MAIIISILGGIAAASLLAWLAWRWRAAAGQEAQRQRRDEIAQAERAERRKVG